MINKYLVALVAVVLCATAPSTADTIGAPTMAVQYSQLPDGNWEYIYDLYGGGVAYLARTGLAGFDTAAIINQYAGGLLWQKWDYVAATNDPSYYAQAFGSYSTDGLTWTQGGWAWSIDNPWHTPSEYVGAPTVFGPVPSFTFGGNIIPEGQSLDFAARITTGAELHGLLLTFRIVHADGPGNITWWTYDYINGEMQGTTTGPVPEPATLILLALGGPAILRRRSN